MFFSAVRPRIGASSYSAETLCVSADCKLQCRWKKNNEYLGGLSRLRQEPQSLPRVFRRLPAGSSGQSEKRRPVGRFVVRTAVRGVIEKRRVRETKEGNEGQEERVARRSSGAKVEHSCFTNRTWEEKKYPADPVLPLVWVWVGLHVNPLFGGCAFSVRVSSNRHVPTTLSALPANHTPFMNPTSP